MSDIIKKIKEFNDEKLNLFVRELVDNCNNNSLNQQAIGMGYTKFNEGFIGFKTRISYGSNYSFDYTMNDYDTYIDFFKFLKKKHTNSDDSNLSDIINDIYEYVRNYFKTEKEIKKDPGYSFLRDQIVMEYLESTTNNPDNDEEWAKNKNALSIKVFKNKGVAMCSERTALAQNLLALLGIQSYYCSGIIKNGSEKECTGHAFNIVKNNDKYYIVDFSVPAKVYKNETLYSTIPYFVEIPEDKIDSLLNDKYAIEFLNYKYDISSGILEKKYIENNRIYGVGLIEIGDNKILR